MNVKNVKTNGTLEEFSSSFAEKYNSAIDIWADERQLDKLKGLVISGARFKSILWDSEDNGDRLVLRQQKAGWIVFAIENNMDSNEAILFKV